MPIIIEERQESRDTTGGDNPSVDLKYWIKGTSDDLVAKGILRASAPLFYPSAGIGALVRQSYSVTPIGPDLWDGIARYGRKAKKETGQSTYQFETSGGSQKITQSLATVGSYAPSGKTAPDFKGAIGVTKDSVEGVDITVPVCSFSETHYLSVDVVTPEYKVGLYAITGRVNSEMWRGFAAGEVLFLGASGSLRSEDDWEISYKFAANPNIASLTIGNITGIAKKGWEYLWVRYIDEEDTSAKCLVKRPQAVYVEQVYRTADFTLLGIGS